MTNVTNITDLERQLPLHERWLNRQAGGERLVCSYGADLREASLSEANLSNANLSDTNLSNANLSRAHLSRANLSRANLSDTNLSEASLSRANLSNANLSDASLTRAIIPFSAYIDARGYTFAWSYDRNDSQELRFYCGYCRDFNYEEAQAHWLSDSYHDKELGKAKMKVVDFIKEMFEAGFLLVKP